MLDLRGTFWRKARLGFGCCEGERFTSAVCGGDEGGCGFERDAGEGWEGDGQGAEDVGDR